MSHQGAVTGFLRGLADHSQLRDASDFELIHRFATQKDETAFQAILRRHGAMVLSVCRTAAGCEQDAEDAFQATFLVLARKAHTIRQARSLGSWLFGVACRAGLRAKALAIKSQQRELRAARNHEGQTNDDATVDNLSWRDAQAAIHQEVDRLADRLRAPVILCYFEGLTQDDAARRLGWSRSTFKRRLDQARDLLRRRLLRRGLGPAAVLAASVVTLARPTAALAAHTIQAVVQISAGQPVGAGLASAQVLNITRSIMKAYFLTKVKLVAAAVALSVLSVAVGYSTLQAMAPASSTQEIAARQAESSKGPQDAAKRDAKAPVVQTGQEAAQKKDADKVPPLNSEASRESINNLKIIALAMHNYHDVFGGLPPPAIKNKQGKALLSWRVAVLPFIDHDHLYRQFKLNEPWDSEHNKKLIVQMPRIYTVPAIRTKEPGQTFYQVFVGKGTPFESINNEGGNIKIADITDGTSNTIMAVEAANPVIWTKPDDLTFDPKGALPKLGVYSDGFNAAFCDGSVQTIRRKLENNVLRALITRNGGEIIPRDALRE